MKHRTIYRICLLAVILITMAGGIFYYMNYVERQVPVTEGTLVEGEGSRSQVCAFSAAAGTEGLAKGKALYDRENVPSADGNAKGASSEGGAQSMAAEAGFGQRNERRDSWRQTPFI